MSLFSSGVSPPFVFLCSLHCLLHPNPLASSAALTRCRSSSSYGFSSPVVSFIVWFLGALLLLGTAPTLLVLTAALHAALLPSDGPTGAFLRDGEPIAW